jgi:hypothetical protein
MCEFKAHHTVPNRESDQAEECESIESILGLPDAAVTFANLQRQSVVEKHTAYICNCYTNSLLPQDWEGRSR